MLLGRESDGDRSEQARLSSLVRVVVVGTSEIMTAAVVIGDGRPVICSVVSNE